MSHVAPHRLADLVRGRLTGGAARRAHRHVDGCARCRRALDQVRGAHAAFAEVAAAPAPELRWDRVRAQTYWQLGTGSHPSMPVAAPPSPRRWPWLAAPLGLAVAAAGVWFALTPSTVGPLPAVAVAPPVVAPAPAVIAPAAPMTAVVTLVEASGAVVTAAGDSLVGGSAVGAHGLGAGDRITTADGRVAAQFGPASTITVGPHSSVTLAHFDARAVELVLGDRGRVDIEVSHRAADQRFVVRAGTRTVEVRGTAFRVERDGARVAVACEHGRVAVATADGADGVELGAGQALAVADGEPVLARQVRPMSEAELGELIAARPQALPQWTDPATIFRTTAALPLVVPAGHVVQIDGVPAGVGSLWRRLPPGRHLVEARDRDGRAASQWVELDGATADRPVALAQAEPALAATGTATARRQRLVELSRALDQEQLRGCVRSLAKQGLADGTHVELEVGVQASGAIRYLNIVETDLPDRMATCVRDVVGQTRLGAGAQVSWRHRVTF